MKKDGELLRRSRPRQVRNLNNIEAQGHRDLKRLTRPGLGFGGFWAARQTRSGYEAMATLRKAQVRKPFDPVYMRALYEYGDGKATMGYPWTKRPPWIEEGQDTGCPAIE